MDFLSFYWRDVLDIALVTLLLYRILLLIRGTRAFSALIGLVVLVAVYALSHFIGLYSLSWLLGEPVRFTVPCHRDPVS